MRRSFFSRKLGEWVFCDLEPISKEEWEAIPNAPGKLSAVAYDDGYYRVVDYFTESDCIYLNQEQMEAAGRPPVIDIGEEDRRMMDEKRMWRVRRIETLG